MRKLLLATVASLAMTAAGNAAIISNIGVNPTSGSGTFANAPGGGAFDDQYTFQLVGAPAFLTIASVTNTFANGATDFITGFTASVLNAGADGLPGGGDDITVIGPVAATANCGVSCQGMAGAAFLDIGNYYLDISGTGGGTSGYGGNLSVAAVPEASTWAMLLLGFAGVGLFGMRRRERGFRLA
jgi:PEP-CTERM motif